MTRKPQDYECWDYETRREWDRQQQEAEYLRDDADRERRAAAEAQDYADRVKREARRERMSLCEDFGNEIEALRETQAELIAAIENFLSTMALDPCTIEPMRLAVAKAKGTP